MCRRIKGFEPIVFEDSEVLLLGTLPGALSLKKEYYYADEGNYFWEFFSEYAGQDKPQSKEAVIKILKGLKVALWDIYESAVREDEAHKETSKDSDIVDVEWNDILSFLQAYPNIKRVGLLGKKAYKEFIRKYPNIKAECLPSTSGSNGGQWGGKPIDRGRIGWIKFTEFIEQKNDMELSQFFKSMVEQDRSAVVICDLNHTVIYMNPAACDRYEKRGGKGLVGSNLLNCHNNRSNEMIEKTVAWFKESKSNNRIYTFYSEKENMDVYMIALRDEDGELIGYYEKHEYRNRETEEMYKF